MHEIRVGVGALLVLAGLFACTEAAAQESPPASSAGDTRATTRADEEQPANTTEALQNATQNPVASLISVPLQNNTNFDIGSANRTGNVLNIQPVIPMHLTADWNLITRIIQPIVFPYS